MDVCKQRDAEIDHIAAQNLTFPSAIQCNGQRRSTGHGSDSGQISGPVITEHLPGVPSGIGTGDQVQNSKPNVMSQHDNDDDLQKGRELMGDHALITQVAEGRADVEWQDRDYHPLYNLQHNSLELLQQAAGQFALRPYRRKPDQQRECQRAHDGHDLRNVQLEYHSRQIAQAFHIRCNDHPRDQSITCRRAHKCRADRADIG